MVTVGGGQWVVGSRWWTQGDGQWARSPEIPVLAASVAYVEAFLTGRYIVLKNRKGKQCSDPTMKPTDTIDGNFSLPKQNYLHPSAFPVPRHAEKSPCRN